MNNHSTLSLLQKSLNPSLTKTASQTLLCQISYPGFLRELLIIGMQKSHPLPIRQSSLIYIKNALVDHYKERIILDQQDRDVIKASILQGLIINCWEKAITPTIREIIFVMAEREFPNHWQDVLPEIADKLANSGSFDDLYGSIEALKALMSAFSKSVNQKVTLYNLCNKIVLPLLTLISKLFQNYSESFLVLLISIFKIFSTITYFLIPQIILKNIHSLMIFIKKILDLDIESGSINKQMYNLKKICLRILYRFYQRHLNYKYTELSKDIIRNFHQKYTKGLVESLLVQITNQAKLTQHSKSKNVLQLTKFSLSCLSYIYQNHQDSAKVIDHYKEKIIYICLCRYRLKQKNSYESYGHFQQRYHQHRTNFCAFLISLLRNQSRKLLNLQQGTQNSQFNSNNNNQNNQQVDRILGCLFQHIQKGDMEMKELCLYIFSDIAKVLPEVDSQIQQKMVTFITNYVKPLLKSNETSTIIKLRCCQIITKYSYVQIPQQELNEMGQCIYSCLLSSQDHPDPSSIQTYLQISAIHSFNSLLHYPSILSITSSFLPQILSVYTSLLQTQTSIIKCLQDLLDSFQGFIGPYGDGLVEMLGGMYFGYLKMVHQDVSNTNTTNQYIVFNQRTYKGSQDQQDEEEDDDDYDNKDNIVENNYLNAARACLAAIRQILQSQSFTIQNDSTLQNILLQIFTDKSSLSTQQGFNMLNLMLFKQSVSSICVSSFWPYFIMIIYGILPLPLNKPNFSSFPQILPQLLQCGCLEPDQDLIQNSIGCLRNFIAKVKQIRELVDPWGNSALQLLLNTVQYVHLNMYERDGDKTATKSERIIMLTIYIALIQWKVLSQQQVQLILKNVLDWYNKQNSNLNNSKEQNQAIFTPMYLQILFVCLHYYPQSTLNQISAQIMISQQLLYSNKFTCDYQLSRILIGVTDILSFKLINSSQLLQPLLNNNIISIIQKLICLRDDQKLDQVGEEDQAEEDRVFGMDQNTHVIAWDKNQWAKQNHSHQYNQQQQYNQPQYNQSNNIFNKNNQLNQQNNNQMQEQQEQSDQGWDEQFNKYYQSPYDQIDQIKYFLEMIKSDIGSNYTSLMSVQTQQKLSNLILNSPSKFNSNLNSNNNN